MKKLQMIADFNAGIRTKKTILFAISEDINTGEMVLHFKGTKPVQNLVTN